MKAAYPIILTQGAENIVVYVPDFEINTQGAEARREAGDGLVTLVDVDFAEYRRRNEMKTVRRNVSLPSWLDAAAREADVNVSAVLSKALKKELRISDR